MRKLTVVLAVAMLLAPISSAHSQARRPFSFQAANVQGFVTGGAGTYFARLDAPGLSLHQKVVAVE